MKPLQGDQQLRSVSLAYSVALQALKPKSSPRRRGLDASTHRGLTESSGEVFLLDILSHRTSAIATSEQLSLRVSESELPMAFPIKICSVCSEEFELRPDKPGFANRCPACSEQESVEPASKGGNASPTGSNKELNQARKNAMRDLLYRKDR